MPTVPIRRSDEEKPIRDVPREVTVTISIDANKNISVDPDPFWVIKSANQEVRWILADGDEDFLIDFNHDSPFYESQFGPDFPVSGLVRRGILPNEGRRYKYTVWVGKEKSDPGGGVKP
jgi:hypothetical protein